MQNSAEVVRMAGSNPTLRQKLGKALPIIGDASNFLFYLYPDFMQSGFSRKPTEQDVRNAVIVGGGGLAASIATGGLDAIPVVLQILGETGEKMGLPPSDLDPIFQAAPALNIENYLREYSYSMNPDEDIPEEDDGLRNYKKLLGIN